MHHRPTAAQTRAAALLVCAVAILPALTSIFGGEAEARARTAARRKPVVVAPRIIGYPDSIVSTGDSITRAYNTGNVAFTDAPANSWSTGTNTSVGSHYLSILVANPGISGHSYNDAVSGAQMTNLASQVAVANGQRPDYVTILMGGNDACTSNEASMTPVATYRAQFEAALQTLSSGSPDARIFVASVPDVYNLWLLLHDNASARYTWSFAGICQSLLANPLSTDQADIDRRARVRQRVIDYNAQLASACAAYIHCHFDNNAIFTAPVTVNDISTRDYFHPSLSGQSILASVSYAAGFNFTDAQAPVTVFIAPSTASRNITVALRATDNAGVAGIEYKLNKGSYQRYTDPVLVPGGSSITYRAVDINGNVEGAHFYNNP